MKNMNIAKFEETLSSMLVIQQVVSRTKVLTCKFRFTSIEVHFLMK